MAGLVAVAAEELPGGGRSAGAGVEKGNVDLALGEGTVDEGQVANDGSEKSKAETRFSNDQGASDAGMRDDVTEAESEERSPAEIDVGREVPRHPSNIHRGAGTVLHKPEAEDEPHRPNANEDEK